MNAGDAEGGKDGGDDDDDADDDDDDGDDGDGDDDGGGDASLFFLFTFPRSRYMVPGRTCEELEEEEIRE